MLAYLKAVTAILATILGSGIVSGHWLTDAQLILSAINGISVFAVPNLGAIRRTRGTVPPVQ